MKIANKCAEISGKVGNFREVFCCKFILAGCMVLLLCLLPGVARADIAVAAKAAVLLDSETGAVLWQKNAQTQLPPASTTKIATALLALNICSEEREVVVSDEAAAVGESSVGLVAGERFLMGELLDAALLKSANDACFAIAEGAVGSEPFFVRLLNLQADVLGASGACFLNTNGLPADGHSMSACDLARLARVAMQNEAFSQRVGAKGGLMEGGSYNRSLKNTNKLLGMNEYVTGIKTGTTNAAGACLVSSMKRGGRSVIAVVLDCADRYGESLELLNYGIDAFANHQLIAAGDRLGGITLAGGRVMIPAVADGDLQVTLPVDFVAADLQMDYAWRTMEETEVINSGDLLGTVTAYYQGEQLGRVNLLADGEYKPGRWIRMWQLGRKKAAGIAKAAGVLPKATL